MTFLEAALELLKQHRKPLNYKKLTELAIKHDLLDHVGREPEAAMQSALANAIKKGQPDLLMRVKPGVFGLRHYPPPTVELRKAEPGSSQREVSPGDADGDGVGGGAGASAGAGATKAREKAGPRKRTRGGRGRGRGKKAAAETAAAGKAAQEPAPAGTAEVAPPAEQAPPAPEAVPTSAPVELFSPVPASTPLIEPVAAPAPVVAVEPAVPEAEAEADREGDAEAEEPVGPPSSGTVAPPRPGLPAAVPHGVEGAHDERRRRRRRRRRGRGPEALTGPPGTQAPALQPGPGASAPAARSLADAAYEILRHQPEGRPVHVRQLTDMAISRRLIRPDGAETWRAVRVALQQEIRDRLAHGLRPRIRFAGGALFAVADRQVDSDLLAVERALSADAEAVRRVTRQAIARRLARMPGPAYETIARLSLERLEFGGLETVKRTAEALYIAVARPRGSAEVRTLVSIRPGAEQGRRAVGELRVGVSAKGFADGLLMAAGRLLPEAAAEAGTAGPPVELWDGDHLAALLVKLGIGVVRATMPLEYLDADFFADLQEG